jgi:hypothetical protein
MKKFAVCFSVLLAIALGVVAIHAAPVIVAGSPLTVNGTTTNAITYAFSYNPTLQQYTVQHGALTNTSDIVVKFYANVTSNIVNAVQIGNWSPNTTNAATEIIPANVYTVTNYSFTSITTVNSQNLFMSYGQ